MAYNTPNSLVASNSAVISGTASSSTLIMPTVVGSFVPVLVSLSVVSLGGLTTPPTVSLGTTAGGTDVMSPTLLTGLNVINKVLTLALSSSKVVSGTPIYCNVGVVGIAASYNFRCTIIGTFLA